MTNIETINDCMVGLKGDDIVIMIPKNRLSRSEALRLAAWLVAIAAHGGYEEEFLPVLKAVLST